MRGRAGAVDARVSTGDRVRTDDWWFHDDGDDGFFRFVRLSVSLSVALSVARDQRALSPISPSLFASFGALLVLVFTCVGVYHRVGAWVGVGEDGGIGQETNDRQPVSMRYPGGPYMGLRCNLGSSTYSGHQRVVSLPPVHVRTDTQTKRKDSPRRPVIGAYQRVLALQVRAKYGEPVLVGVADRESSVIST
jgi:hypothetical protein